MEDSEANLPTFFYFQNEKKKKIVDKFTVILQTRSLYFI